MYIKIGVGMMDTQNCKELKTMGDGKCYALAVRRCTMIGATEFVR